MRQMTRISIIGAGSAVFSRNLIRDICLTPTLAGSTISLMDINPGRLAAIARLCERYAAEMSVPLTVEATDDRRHSMQGADFVINTALVAGHDRMVRGWDIAREHGYRHGGSLHIMHDEPFWVNFYQLRFFESVLQDMREVCPEAWYLQVANPVFTGMTHLSRKFPELRLVGLCHGFAGVYQIADVLGLDRDGLTYEIPGVNHTVFLTEAYHNGRDIFPLLDQWREEHAAEYWKTCRKSDGLGPQAFDLYQRFGAFPIGDTCTVGGGSWPWWYHTDAETEAKWNEDPAAWWERYLAWGLAEVATIERAAWDDDRPVSEVFPPEMSGEVMVPMIESIAHDTPRVLIGNILNKGELVPGVPEDFAVEVPLLTSKRGIEGVQTKPLPAGVLALIHKDRIAPVTAELDAYTFGRRESLLQLILMDPWTRSIGQAESLLESILAMPEHEEMRHHYR